MRSHPVTGDGGQAEVLHQMISRSRTRDHTTLSEVGRSTELSKYEIRTLRWQLTLSPKIEAPVTQRNQT